MSVPQGNQPPATDGYGISRLSIARVYNHMLHGKDNFAADRAVVAELEAAGVEPCRAAQMQRAFVLRAVRAVARCGVAQFLDLGCGLPISPSVDEVARAVRRRARVVYVDNDPVVVAHVNAMLSGPGVVAIHGDLRDPGPVAEEAGLRGRIDFGRPVAVLLTAVMHFIGDDEDPDGILAAFRELLAPGSCLVLSAGTCDDADPEALSAVLGSYANTVAPLTLRPRDQITRFFDGFGLLKPGVVKTCEWRPDEHTDRAPLKTWALCGVGQLRK